MWKIYDNEKDNNDDDDGQWKHFIGKAHWSLQLRWSNQLIVISLCITSKKIFSVHTVFRVYILCCVDIENTLFQKNLIFFIFISVLLYCHCPTLQCFTLEKHRYYGFVNLKEDYQNKQGYIRKDLKELEKLIYPKYQKGCNRHLSSQSWW